MVSVVINIDHHCEKTLMLNVVIEIQCHNDESPEIQQTLRAFEFVGNVKLFVDTFQVLLVVVLESLYFYYQVPLVSEEMKRSEK